MKIFFGAAIQGAENRRQRAKVHQVIIDAIKSCGCTVISEHTTGSDYDDTIALLENSFGPIPPKGKERTVYVRKKMIELVEGDIDAAIFEVSTPSLGTGIELAHAYLRPRLGIQPIPVLALYQKDYWPNKLSSMIKGITAEEISHFQLYEYARAEDAYHFIPLLIEGITSGKCLS